LEAEKKEKNKKKASNNLAEVTLALDLLKIVYESLDKELWHMKACLVLEHEEGFNKSIRQVILLYNISANDEHFSVEKDVYQKSLVHVDDIPIVEREVEDNPSTPFIEMPTGE